MIGGTIQLVIFMAYLLIFALKNRQDTTCTLRKINTWAKNGFPRPFATLLRTLGRFCCKKHLVHAPES